MKKRNHRMNIFYIPALLLILFFVLWPLIEAFRISFTQWNGYSQDYKYIGIKNYLKLFKDSNFLISFRNTIIYGFGSTLLQNLLGLAYAVFLNSRFKGHSIVRTFIYMPVMISSLIMGYIIYFFVMYNRGVFNEIIGIFGMTAVDWMASGNRGVIIITLMNSWQYVGIAMVIYMAGLQNIPKMYLEAAEIDGANPWQRFRHITFPLLLPSISSAVVLNLIGGLKLYDIIISLSGGGPGFSTHSLASYVSNQYFKAQNAGYSAAVGIFTFLFIMVVSNIFTNYFSKKEVDMG
ncbi:sugar ABC transporter permease [Eisenbergiella massiliensis]|uniref:Sugar ABC transporter permease n=2 Tax=Lachnospiraceae TaxID=186803 RepID=A0A3E3IJK9_9FIRM|nr:sugar ABC transporter permease [Eisenbergiella porci]MDU5291171.1 sugar ABC transporter permease [Clostridium sp.]RGE67192.1 sugar ABC transporter permease [Eisenbergiella massiliensis]